MKSLKDMITYNKKDVEDTRYIWNYALKHFEPKFNMNTYYQYKNNDSVLRCKVCGSTNIHKLGIKYTPQGTAVYQRYRCRDHGGEALKVAIQYHPAGKKTRVCKTKKGS
jgi:hypothetical protein